MVMAQSLFIALKKKYPDCQLDIVAPAWSLPLIARMPEITTGIEMPVGHGKLDLKARKQLANQLQKKNYQQAIILPNSLKSALVPFLAKIPIRTGWRGEIRYFLLNDIRSLNKKIYTKTVQRFVALAYPKNTPPDFEILPPKLAINIETRQQAVKKYQLKIDQQKILTLCAGAEFGASKRWPEQYYADLAKKYIQQGWQVWLFGSAKDQVVCNTINQYCDHQAMDLSGRTTLAEAIDLISLSTAVVSNDSGLMHIAAALHLPVVAIYGSTDPFFTPPLNQQHQIVRLNLSCSPCFQRECPKQHLNCLSQLPVNMVDNAIIKLTSKTLS